MEREAECEGMSGRDARYKETSFCESADKGKDRGKKQHRRISTWTSLETMTIVSN